jgi:hypothetical protein
MSNWRPAGRGPRLDLLRLPPSLRFIFKNPNFTTAIDVSLAYSILQLTVYVLTELDSSNCVHVLEIDHSSERNTVIWPLMVFYKLNLVLEMY